MAATSGAHAEKKRREGESEGEGEPEGSEREEGGRGLIPSPRTSAAAGIRGQHRAMAARHRAALLLHEEDNTILQKSP
jgi:hypothetical protein